MRLVLVMLLAGLAAVPLSVSAQAGEEGADVKSTRSAFAFIPEHLKQRLPQHRHKPAPPSEPAPEEPALELKLDDAGVGVVPSPPRTPEGYTLEEMELRVKRARTGLYVSAGVYVIGLAVAIPGATGDCGYVYWGYATPPARCDPLLYGGTVLSLFGVVGMITSGVLLRRHKRDRDWLRQAHYGTPRRVQWDLARSRLVF